jgi:hypothetical protein
MEDETATSPFTNFAPTMLASVLVAASPLPRMFTLLPKLEALRTPLAYPSIHRLELRQFVKP